MLSDQHLGTPSLTACPPFLCPILAQANLTQLFRCRQSDQVQLRQKDRSSYIGPCQRQLPLDRRPLYRQRNAAFLKSGARNAIMGA